MCLRELVLGLPIEQPAIRPGLALRYWDEIYLSPGDLARELDDGRAEVVRGERADVF
jgi:hypothetical protein